MPMHSAKLLAISRSRFLTAQVAERACLWLAGCPADSGGIQADAGH